MPIFQNFGQEFENFFFGNSKKIIKIVSKSCGESKKHIRTTSNIFSSSKKGKKGFSKFSKFSCGIPHDGHFSLRKSRVKMAIFQNLSKKFEKIFTKKTSVKNFSKFSKFSCGIPHENAEKFEKFFPKKSSVKNFFPKF